MTWKTFAAVILGLGLTAAVGCDKKDDKPAPKPDEKKEHTHGNGPNGGVMSDAGGGKYHVEFKPNHDKKDATVWVYGPDEKTPAAVQADVVTVSIANTTPPFKVELKPTNKGADGKASTFTGPHNGFGQVQEYKGTITFKVGTDQFTADFEEKP